MSFDSAILSQKLSASKAFRPKWDEMRKSQYEIFGFEIFMLVQAGEILKFDGLPLLQCSQF